MWRTRGVRAAGAASATKLPLHDSRRLGALLEELRPRLAAVANRYTRDPDAAQDVVQNAFEKVMRYGDRFRGDSKPSTWIYRIVANEALMWLRAERRRNDRWETTQSWDQLRHPDPGPTPEERAERASDVDHLRRALAALRQDDRAVVQGALAERSYQEVGQRLGLRPGAAKSRAFRARQQLRKFLQEL